MLRVNGALRETELPVQSQEDLQRSLGEVLSGAQRQHFAEHKELDFAIGVPNLGRFRTNLFWERGVLAFSIRAVPSEVPRLDTLGLPPVLADVALSPRGLVLVTGVTGSGKSTTLAAMIRHLNENRSVNIVGIEDPIEFVHPDQKAIIAQREVGSDTRSFHDALRHVLRQDPDVIMLGEIRDADSMETLLKAAETGHQVFSTLHTTDAAQTISRILSFFPPHQQNEVRAMLASALRAIISLRLVPPGTAGCRPRRFW
jgi:twitching motility protein PilT